MAKIPFSIEYRPQIESEEYKVETKNGQPVEILKWNVRSINNRFPIAAIVSSEKFDEVVGYSNEGYCGRADYSLSLITPEPELSEFEERIFKLLRQYKECETPLTPENIKAEASMLWQDFEKYFFVLYGKEGEGDSALRSFYRRGFEDGKAEALKDLPRWRKCDKNTIYNTKFNLVENGVGRFLMVEGYQIGIDSLEKLPGFNE